MSDLDSFMPPLPDTVVDGDDNTIVQTGPGQFQVGMGLLYEELQREHTALQSSHRNLVLVCRTLEAELTKAQQANANLEQLVKGLSTGQTQAPARKPAATKRTAARK